MEDSVTFIRNSELRGNADAQVRAESFDLVYDPNGDNQDGLNRIDRGRTLGEKCNSLSANLCLDA